MGTVLITGASRGIGRATALLWLLSDAASYVSGAVLDAAGGL